MTILGIETSCDETAAAVVMDGASIISDIKATSLDIHIKYGGVVPDKAAREQLQAILPVINEALLALPNGINDVDAIAVTYGPGLIGSLLVGVETTKALALSYNKPLIPVNHMVGHIYANWLTSSKNNQTYKFPTTPPPLPALVLIVSGGHSEMVLMKSHDSFEFIGSTRDDAAGECFDKCGRLLGLPYPYGIYVSAEADKWTPSNPFRPKFPRPMANQKNFELSFSGLKTAVLNYLKEEEPKVTSEEMKQQLKIAVAHEVQEAITDVLVKKFNQATKQFPAESLIVCGGVAANKRLREKLPQDIFIPDTKLCTDNAAAIAAAAFYHNRPVPVTDVTADPAVRFYAAS